LIMNYFPCSCFTLIDNIQNHDIESNIFKESLQSLLRNAEAINIQKKPQTERFVKLVKSEQLHGMELYGKALQTL